MTAKPPGTYSNPFWPSSFPDPFILKVRGRYYAYATEHETYPPAGSWVFPILTSTDLVHWREVGKALPALGQPYSRYWAPEVTVHNGQFFLYYAVHTTEFAGSIRVAVAQRPEGPFADSGHNLTGHLLPWAIDPHVFRDQDGQWYLYMTVEYWNDPDGFVGSGNVVDGLIDPFTLAGHITRVTPPRHPWQLFEAQRQERGGVDWYTVEGPAVIRHRGRYYETFSGGCYYRDNYAVSYATSETPMGPNGMHDTSWHDWERIEGDAFLIQGDREYMISPGHNSLVLGPNNVDLYIAYHAWQQDSTERRPCLDRLFWHGNDLWTAAPTHTPQYAPTLPRIRELFEEPTLHSSWQQHDGNWQVSNGEGVQEDATLSHAALRHQDQLSSAWLLEVNLRHVTGDGSYGVLLESDIGTMVRVSVTRDSQLAVWSSESPAIPMQAMPLPATLLTSAWHQLIISYSGSILSVQLDGLQPLEAVVDYPPLTFALFTEGCSSAFSCISLTDHFRDELLNDQQTPTLLGWQAESNDDGKFSNTSLSDWRVQDGMLDQTSALHGEHIVLKGSFHEQYECGATLKLLHTCKQGQPALGLVLWQNRTEKLYVQLLQSQSRWTLSIESSSSPPDANASLTLPATFDPFIWHTLRLRRWHDQLMIYLDGPEVLTIALPSHPEKFGLATRNAAVAFMSVWQTALC
jgi:GH43 family beta-xylosidase